MNIQIINPKGLYNPVANGYSHAIKVAGAQMILYVAGQGGEYLDGTLPPAFETQVENAFNNLALAITASGGRFHHTAKLSTFVVDHNEEKLDVVTYHVRRVFGEHLPAQTLVPVPRLALDQMLFEVDAIVPISDK